MMKRVFAVLSILFVLISVIYADPSLLMRSVQLSDYQELVAMAQAFGLDPDLDEASLRAELLDHFGVSDSYSEVSLQSDESAVQNYSLAVMNAGQMYTSETVVILEENVSILFSLEGENDRTLTAQKVVIDFDSKRLEAMGDVILDEGSDSERSFQGNIVYLDWARMDIVVFDGKSQSSRSNVSGEDFSFNVKARELSYADSTDGVFFRSGEISTWDTDPYWSISAKKMALSEGDLFVDNAVLNLGRVPVLYLPFFFYPGTTLAFNPAIGLSSDKGAFLNTTTEIYGKYPKLGRSGSDSEDQDVVSSVFSLLNSDSEAAYIRDGLYYRLLEEDEELGDLQAWAFDSNSYLAIFADVYQKTGLVLGFDTKNNFLSRALSLSGIGAVGYVADQQVLGLNRFRFTFDFDLNYRNNGLSIAAKLPVLSDPYVQNDYLNRNTVFGLDSVFGSEQSFPSDYKFKDKYTWSAEVSYYVSSGNYSFRLNSLKADVDYRLDKVTQAGNTFYEQKIVEASLPYLSISSSGKFFQFSGKDTVVSQKNQYSSALAQQFEETRVGLLEESKDDALDSEMDFYAGPSIELESTTTIKGAMVEAGYTFDQTLDNRFSNDSVYDSFYTKLNGSLYLNANAPGSVVQVRETLRPAFSFSATDKSKESAKDISEFNVSSAFEASVPVLGLKYVLNQKVYSLYNKESLLSSENTEHWGQWEKTDITAHSITLSKKLDMFQFGVYFQLKPLKEIIKPSVSFAYSGYSAEMDFSFEREDSSFERGEGNLKLAYSSDLFKFSLANNYDFSKVSGSADAWKGYSLSQKAELVLLKDLILSQSSSFKGCFEPVSLKAKLSYKGSLKSMTVQASSEFSFSGAELEKDSLAVDLGLSSDLVRFWKNRGAVRTNGIFSLDFDFANPYSSSLDFSFGLDFSLARFIDLSFMVRSSNRSFFRYYGSGSFSLSEMFEDLLRSFDFAGGRHDTGFNLSAFSLQLVHYMRDWNLYIDAEGNLTTQYSGRYEWVPKVTVSVKWNVLPELKTNAEWNAHSKEWN